MTMPTESLLAWLPQQRWFGHKTQALQGVDLVDVVVLDDGPPALALALVSVRFADADPALYHLPVLLDEDGTSRDAVEEPHRLALLFELMAHGHTIKGDKGAIEFGGPGLDPMAPLPQTVRALGAEQSNTSVVFDDTTIVKLFRRVEPGSNPDLELSRLLTHEGFANCPPQVGEFVYRGEIDGEEVSIDLGVAQQFVGDASDGWDWVLERIGALFDQVDEADVAEDRGFLVEQRAGACLDAIQELGEATGALHVALSREESDPELAPEPVDQLDLRAWAEGATAYLERVAAGFPELDAMRPAIAAQIDKVKELTAAGYRTRVHGDYHLGQVIRGLRWMILDFEGEPVRPLEERRAKHSPLKDVAGMLRSFSYAATAALFDRAEPDSDEWKRLQPWAHTWEALARDRFLSSYLRKSHEGRFLAPERETLALLLDFFEIDKALYELEYELRHRPEWVRIPAAGIARVIERGEKR